MAPLVSIIIPTYNSEATLRQALQSVVLQDYKHKEVLIIDGSSTDGSCDIVKEFAEEFDFIHYISEKDNGIYDAMNKGISKSKGDWLYFLGSDDKLISNDTLSKIFTDSELVNNDVIYGKVISDRWNGEYGKEFQMESFFKENICHQAIFFKRNVFELIGSFNLKYRAHADWDHNIRWFTSSRVKKKYIDEVIAEYSNGGYSSKGDMIFAFEKEFKHLFYLHRQISLKDKIQWIRLLTQAAKLYESNYLIRKMWTRSLSILSILFQDLIRGNISSTNKISFSKYLEPVIALNEIKRVIPVNQAIILADQNEWGNAEKVCKRKTIPFMEHNNLYWGTPLNDLTAIEEISRQHKKGIRFLIFARPAFWWLDYYVGMHDYLKSNFKCILHNESLIVFDLKR